MGAFFSLLVRVCLGIIKLRFAFARVRLMALVRARHVSECLGLHSLANPEYGNYSCVGCHSEIKLFL